MIQADKRGLIYDGGRLACSIRANGEALELRMLKLDGIFGFTRAEAEELGRIIAERIVEMEAMKGKKKSKILGISGLYICQKCKEEVRNVTVMITRKEAALIEWRGGAYQVETLEMADNIIKATIHCPHCNKPMGKEVVANVVKRYLSGNSTD